jgi:hypothetical protein
MFTTVTNGVQTVNYTMVFIIPCILTVICAIVFFLGFKEKEPELVVAQGQQA